MRPLLNFREAAVDDLLKDFASEHGYRILLKPRLRDVIDVDNLNLSGRERNFTFTAHIDFVAADVATNLPVLAIEYDGPQHGDAEQVERDSIKDRLLEAAGLPLLRIDNHFARKEGKWRVLTYILSMHETGKAFYEAQESGSIPEDEIFIHNLIIDTSDPDRPMLTGLDTEALIALSARMHSGRSLWHAGWGRYPEGVVETQCVLALPNGQFLTSQCRLRHFAINGISAGEVADELATAELAWIADRYDAGEAVALSAEQGAKLLAELGDGSKFSTASGWNVHWGTNFPPN